MVHNFNRDFNKKNTIKNYLFRFLQVIIGCILLTVTGISQDYNLNTVDKKYTMADGLPSNEVHFIFEDNQHYIWFCTDEGLSRFDGTNFKNYDQDDGLPEIFVLKLKRLSSGRIIGWTLQGSLFYLVNDRIVNINLGRHICERFDECVITDIIEESNGDLYITTAENCGFVVVDTKGRVEDREAGQGKGVMYKNTTIDSQQFLYRTQSGSKDSFYINTTGIDTSFRLNGNRNSQTRPIRDKNDLYYLIDDHLLTITDSSSKITKLPESCWNLGFKNEKLLLYSLNKGLYEYSISDGRISDKKNEDYFITHSMIDSRGIEWIATYANGVIRNFVSKVKRLELETLQNAYIHKAVKSKDGSLFVLAEINELKVASLIKFDSESESKKLDDNISVAAFFQYLPNEDQLLYIKNPPKSKEYLLCRNLRDEKLSDKIEIHARNFFLTGINFFQGNHIYFTDSCIYTVEKSIIQKVCFGQKQLFQVDLPKELDVRSLSLNNNLLYLGTKNRGLFVVNLETLAVTKYNHQLSSNHVKSITFKSKDTLFVATNKGFHRLVWYKDSLRFKGYIDNTLAFPNQEVNSIQYFDDTLLFSYPHALNFVSTKIFDEVEKAQTVPFISYVEYSNAENKNSIKHLDYKNNYIRFSLMQFGFENQTKKEIWYRLKGYKDKWTKSTLGSLEFISLLPNTYEFQIAVVDKSKNSMQICDQFVFIINRPYYMSWWMYLIYCFLTLALLLGIFYRIRRYYKIKQTKIIGLKSLKLKVLMSQLNPHFIFNVLNGIQSLIVTEKVLNASDRLADFSKLLRNIIDTTDQSLITIKEDIFLIKEYCNFEIIRKNGKIDVEVDIDPSVETYYIPPLLIQPLIENSIRHGFKDFKTKQGLICIKITDAKECIKFEIKDNGCGMDELNISKLGKGIQLVKERVEIVNERNNEYNQFNIDSTDKGIKITFNLIKILKPWKA